MDHSELVLRVAHWLRGSKKLSLVLTEIGTDNYESPDVIGWEMVGGSSWVVECKVSRADFLRDAKKPFRQFPEIALGEYRVYATPPGLLKPEDLPQGWGLVEARGKIMRLLQPPVQHTLNAGVHKREKRLMISAFRRATEGWGTNVLGGLTPNPT